MFCVGMYPLTSIQNIRAKYCIKMCSQVEHLYILTRRVDSQVLDSCHCRQEGRVLVLSTG